MLPIIGWIMLWFRPSWGFLFFFGACIGLLSLAVSVLLLISVGALSSVTLPELLAALASDFAWNVGVFAVLGAVIVGIRGGKIERNPTETEIDAELARFRARAASGTDAGSPGGPTGPHEREATAGSAREGDLPPVQAREDSRSANRFVSGLAGIAGRRHLSGPVRLWIVASLAIWAIGFARFTYNEGGRVYAYDYIGDYWPYWLAPFGLGALLLGVRWVRDGYKGKTPRTPDE
jgi:hypothetical protein